ncbi:MAG: aspartate aminotransferase family protein [Phycisphaeraceae bacterium]|nr:aspartate aminotransferase family protein [Phycisphaeraceae bacterium]
MPAPAFPLTPRNVPTVQTEHRRIVTPIPVPQSIPILQKLRTCEPLSMSGQPPIIWDHAAGVHVFDRFGNQWLDFSSGVLVTNAGHSNPAIAAGMIDQINHGLLHNYCFPSEIRSQLVDLLCSVAPEGLKKAFLLTTGSEATEACIKLMRTHGLKAAGKRKIGIVTFTHGFHGRTMGAQMAGGVPALKDWIVNLDPAMIQAPFPDGFRQKDTSFDVFLRTLDEAGWTPDDVAGVMLETYQGGSASFAPVEYIKKLRTWCDEHDVVLSFDEVQAGFGRTGTFWGFEHYDITPDLIACGKGISSGMPLSAVLGRPKLLDQYPPGSMTSTHTGNPVCCAAALACIHQILNMNLVENARNMGRILAAELKRIEKRFTGPVGAADARGLVGTVQMVVLGTTDPDKALATDIVRRCYEQGLLLFAPVGVGGGTVKIAPPLVIDEPALREGLSVLENSIEAAISNIEQTVSQ